MKTSEKTVSQMVQFNTKAVPILEGLRVILRLSVFNLSVIKSRKIGNTDMQLFQREIKV